MTSTRSRFCTYIFVLMPYAFFTLFLKFDLVVLVATGQMDFVFFSFFRSLSMFPSSNENFVHSMLKILLSDDVIWYRVTLFDFILNTKSIKISETVDIL